MNYLIFYVFLYDLWRFLGCFKVLPPLSIVPSWWSGMKYGFVCWAKTLENSTKWIKETRQSLDNPCSSLPHNSLIYVSSVILTVCRFASGMSTFNDHQPTIGAKDLLLLPPFFPFFTILFSYDFSPFSSCHPCLFPIQCL